MENFDTYMHKQALLSSDVPLSSTINKWSRQAILYAIYVMFI